VALTLAVAAPRRVAALVLVDAAVLPRGAGRLRHGAGLLRALARLPLDFLPVLVADAWRAGPINVWRAAREVLGADLEPLLGAVRAPTLVVWGDRDDAVPLAVGERLAGAIPGARLAVLPRVGHNPMWEAPGAFDDLVEEFLDRVSAASGEQALATERSD
jgi:pimeloyl-ACP methyl ester carboxylesterase